MWKRIELILLLLASAVFFILGKNMSHMTNAEAISEKKQVIVIDAGHGGSDPGKVGVNQILEKDINLKIAEKVKEGLEKKGFEVIMTREKDEMLGNTLTSNKKVSDMQKRVSIINKEKPELAISIHQNSYSDASVSGAQTFYYAGSEKGGQFAQVIQEKLWEIEDNKKRNPKENDSYYLLKHVESPMIIIECGFLSNPDEANRLVTEEYQDKISNAIVNGIESCFMK